MKVDKLFIATFKETKLNLYKARNPKIKKDYLTPAYKL